MRPSTVRTRTRSVVKGKQGVWLAVGDNVERRK